MDTIAVVDFGGQYAHLIANRIRRLGVYSEIVDNTLPARDLAQFKGIVLSGGPRSTLEPDSPGVDRDLFDLGIPVLGLCYGHQLMAKMLGGSVRKGDVREYGIAFLDGLAQDPLFAGLSGRQQVWMSHGDTVTRIPQDFVAIGSTPDCSCAAVRHRTKPLYGLQFHPEVTDTLEGMRILGNFIDLCGCRREWNPKTFLHEIKTNVLGKCDGRKVFLLVSGGVDSSVAFILLNDLLGRDRVLGLHIDNGLMRKGESDDVMRYMREHGFDNLQICDASAEFLSALVGVVEPEKKRNIIGSTFIEVQRKALVNLGLNADEWMLGQGTIYPDTIESAGTRHADRIKTHHNRVELVQELIEKGLVVEPLAQLYKDEVRALGEELGLPGPLVWRHPFPGPGLGVRVLCSDGSAERIDPAVGAAASAIAGVAGYTVSILPVKSVGVQGDERTYAHPALLEGPMEWDRIETISTSITNTVHAINRVLFALDIEPRRQWKPIRSFVTKDRLDMLREIDDCATALLHRHDQYGQIWQMPVVLLPLVNAAGGQCVVVRPISSTNAMTARFAPLKSAVLDGLREKIKQFPGLGDLLLDVTHKPPATIEWE